jgi:hypothetical protein
MRVYVPDRSIAKEFPDDDIGIILSNRDRTCGDRDCILDNGAYTAWKNGIEWNAEQWMKVVARLSKKDRLQWAVVPDVVADREATIDSWHQWAAYMKHDLGLSLAIAVQDGMTPADIPSDAGDSIRPDVVFVGGSIEWKWRTLYKWVNAFPRIHVGKANSLRQLSAAHDAGVESVDGTGFTFAAGRATLRQYFNRIKTPRML